MPYVLLLSHIASTYHNGVDASFTAPYEGNKRLLQVLLRWHGGLVRASLLSLASGPLVPADSIAGIRF